MSHGCVGASARKSENEITRLKCSRMSGARLRGPTKREFYHERQGRHRPSFPLPPPPDGKFVKEIYGGRGRRNAGIRGRFVQRAEMRESLRVMLRGEERKGRERERVGWNGANRTTTRSGMPECVHGRKSVCTACAHIAATSRIKRDSSAFNLMNEQNRTGNAAKSDESATGN